MIKRLFMYVIMTLVFAVSAGAVILVYSVFQGPPEIHLDENTIIYDQDGQVLSVEHGVQNRFWVDLNEVSPHVIDAFLAAEDEHFYDHFGFDLKRILGATYYNILAMDKRQGASTITQQYAKNVFLTNQKTWKRKAQEALIALRLEIFQDKDEILEGYINTIYFGHGQYGIQAASQYYFDKNADELTLEESALLAAIPKGPSVYSPLISYENAMGRQQWVLERMHETGKITETTMERAKDRDLHLVAAASDQEPEVGKYFQDYALRQAADILGVNKQAIDSQGYQVYTTINQDAQKKLEETIQEELPEDSEELQVGAVTIDPQSGKIVAMQGGRNFDETPYNRVTQAERMTGSTFKTFLYYAALVYGYTPSKPFDSRETSFTLENERIYTPGNAGDFANRPVTLAQALAVSDNVYAIKTTFELGPENVVQAAQAFGIETKLEAVPSIGIGTSYVSPMEMAKAYSVLANEGWSVNPYVIEKIVDRNGNIVYQHQSKTPKRMLEENHAFVLTHMLTGMFDNRFSDYMRATGANIAHYLKEHQYAGKSGSTDYDSWMIGYSPEYTTAIWTGYDDHREIKKVQDFRVAKQVWAKYMNYIHQEFPTLTFNAPTGVVGLHVDPISGNLEGPACEGETVLMYYIKGTQPNEVCGR